MPLFAKVREPLFGYLGTLQFTVNVDGEDDNGFLYRVAQERHSELENLIKQQAKDTLGPNFAVLNIRFFRGSVEIIVVFGTLITIFMTFSRYESFIKSVNLLVSQINGLLRRFFESASPGAPGIEVDVTGSWRPSDAVVALQERLTAFSALDYGHLLLFYLILSHAALLALFIWIIVKHLK